MSGSVVASRLQISVQNLTTGYGQASFAPLRTAVNTKIGSSSTNEVHRWQPRNEPEVHLPFAAQPQRVSENHSSIFFLQGALRQQVSDDGNWSNGPPCALVRHPFKNYQSLSVPAALAI